MYRNLRIGLFFLIVFFPVQGYTGGEYPKDLVGQVRNQGIHHSSSIDSLTLLTEMETADSSPLTSEGLIVNTRGNHREEAEGEVSRKMRVDESVPYLDDISRRNVRAFFSSSILRIRSISQQTVFIIRAIPQQTARIMQSIHHRIEHLFSLGAHNLATMETRIQVVLETGRPVVYGVRSFFRSSVLMLRLGHQRIELRIALAVHNTEALSYLVLRYAGFSPDATNRFIKMLKKLVKKEVSKFIGQCFTDEFSVAMCSYFLGYKVEIKDFVYFLRTLHKSPENAKAWNELAFGK